MLRLFVLMGILMVDCAESPTAKDLPDFDISIVRTFHRPLHYSVRTDSSGHRITLTIHFGAGGYEWGDSTETKVRSLDSIEVDELAWLVDELDLVALSEDEDILGLDGSTWELSIPRQGDTVRIERWSPGYDANSRELDDLHELGFYLWHLFDLDEPDEDFY